MEEILNYGFWILLIISIIFFMKIVKRVRDLRQFLRVSRRDRKKPGTQKLREMYRRDVQRAIKRWFEVELYLFIAMVVIRILLYVFW